MADETEIWRRKAARERNARQAAEAMLEQRSLELYQESQVRAQAEYDRRESEERYRLLVEQAPDAIFIESGGEIVFANRAAAELFHAPLAQELLARSMLSLLAPAHRADAENAMREAERGDASRTLEQQALRLDGQVVDIAVTWIAFRYRGQPALQMVVRDISGRKRLEQQLSHQALHDSLTGLPNRRLLIEHLRQAIACARRDGQSFMVCFIDLDRFKWINDNLGHEAGDELLRVVSARMAASLRGSDTVARQSGDEFVLLLRDTADQAPALAVINRVAEAVSQPVRLKGHEVSVTCSVGCSTYPADGQTADALLRFADAAMYCAKQRGRNRLQIYDEELRRRLEEGAQLQEELHQALTRRQLRLEYQPQINIRSGEIVGVEALLRWRHPLLGDIGPARFIPLAEESGLIDSIGAWVMLEACRQAAAWQAAGLRPVRVAVNLSAKQLSGRGLERDVARCLDETGLDPGYLELELTETSSMDSPEHTFPLMHRLKRLGVSIAIDDFGTGFSNMQYLKRLPVDKLKLDGSFIREVIGDPRSMAIVDAIIAMAHRLGLKVVAEMVETEQQALLLGAHGCDLVQGQYFSGALPPEQCAELLARGGVGALPQAPVRDDSRRTLLLIEEPEAKSLLESVTRPDAHRLLLAPDSRRAFDLLASHPVDMVIGNLRHGGLNCIEFLSRVHRRYPAARRLALGGARDFDWADALLSRGAAHRVLLKPWNHEELRCIIDEPRAERLLF